MGSSPFARRYWGNRFYFLFLQVLRCFSSLRSPRAIRSMEGSLPPGCPIRKSTGHGVFAPRRGLSQLVTSFFASESQGIPHAPFVTSIFLSPFFGLLVKLSYEGSSLCIPFRKHRESLFYSVSFRSTRRSSPRPPPCGLKFRSDRASSDVNVLVSNSSPWQS